MSAVIRPAQPSDGDAIRQIVLNAYTPWIERIGKPPGPMLDDYGRRIADRQVWVAEAGAGIVGLIVLEDAGDAVLLDNVAVAPTAHGMGYGRALLAFAKLEARRRGCRSLRLYTHVLMTENLAIYHRLGFIDTGRVCHDGYDRITMAKPLP